jgi:hypothetical protein
LPARLALAVEQGQGDGQYKVILGPPRHGSTVFPRNIGMPLDRFRGVLWESRWLTGFLVVGA